MILDLVRIKVGRLIGGFAVVAFLSFIQIQDSTAVPTAVGGGHGHY